MASMQKIREGIFKISWVNLIPCTPSNNVEIIFSEIAESCKLSYEYINQNGLYLKEVVLEIEIVFAPTNKKSQKLDTIIILASKDGVNQIMKLENSKWKAAFNNKVQDHRCYCGRLSGFNLNFEIVIDFTSNSRVLVKKESKHVLDILWNFWIEKTLADVTFKFEEQVIKSLYFDRRIWKSRILRHVPKRISRKIGKKTFEIKDIQPNVFEHLLRYIYTGDADMDNVDVGGLLAASDKYGMESLKEECELHLSQDLNVGNAVRNLVLAHLHNSPTLRKSTLDLMSRNAKAICSRKDWMDLIKKYPELSFAAMQMMVMG